MGEREGVEVLRKCCAVHRAKMRRGEEEEKSVDARVSFSGRVSPLFKLLHVDCHMR